MIDDISIGATLPLVEQFYSLQGEGFHTGVPSYFIRLGGCQVKCSWCDSKESWDPKYWKYQTVEEISNTVVKSGAKRVVITGGEPLHHQLTPLTSILKREGIEIALESSGHVEQLSGEFDWITLSPKKGKEVLEKLYGVASELKIVITSKEDFGWAEEERRKVAPGCKLFLQPEWSVREKITPKIIEYIKENREWRLSIQSHKYIDIP